MNVIVWRSFIKKSFLVRRFVIGQYVTVHGDVISHVNISHVMVEDGGEYSCTAENRAGKVTHAARLNVYGKKYFLKIFGNYAVKFSRYEDARATFRSSIYSTDTESNRGRG